MNVSSALDARAKIAGSITQVDVFSSGNVPMPHVKPPDEGVSVTKIAATEKSIVRHNDIVNIL